MKTWVAYATSVAVYIAITLFTKRLLTWNLALLYFIVTLDLLPAWYHRRRHASPSIRRVRS